MKSHQKAPKNAAKRRSDHWKKIDLVIKLANEGGKRLEEHVKQCGICGYGKYCEMSMRIFRRYTAKGKKLWERIERNRKVRI